MTKKPAQLSDSLLSHRPRKGAALPQSEAEAANPKPISASRRRRRRSDKTQQLNIKVSQEVLDRFTERADMEDMSFGDLLEKLLKDTE